MGLNCGNWVAKLVDWWVKSFRSLSRFGSFACFGLSFAFGVNSVTILAGLPVKQVACGGCLGGFGSLDFEVMIPSFGLNLSDCNFEECCYAGSNLSKQKSTDSLVSSSCWFCSKT